MTARYYVLMSDKLMDSELRWPAGFRPVQQDAAGHPGAHWWLFDDDRADAALDGKRVNLAISLKDGEPVITYRSAVVSHA